MIESDKNLTLQLAMGIDAGPKMWAEGIPDESGCISELLIEIDDSGGWLTLDQAKALKDFIRKVLRRAKKQSS